MPDNKDIYLSLYNDLGLEKAGVKYTDFTQKFLTNADARKSVYNDLGLEKAGVSYDQYEAKFKDKIVPEKTQPKTEEENPITQLQKKLYEGAGAKEIIGLAKNAIEHENQMKMEKVKPSAQTAIKDETAAAQKRTAEKDEAAKKYQEEVKANRPIAIENSTNLYFKNKNIKAKKGDVLWDKQYKDLKDGLEKGDLIMFKDPVTNVPKLGKNLTGVTAFFHNFGKAFMDSENQVKESEYFLNAPSDEKIRILNQQQRESDEYLPERTDNSMAGSFGTNLGGFAPMAAKMYLSGAAVTAAAMLPEIAVPLETLGGTTAASEFLSFAATAPDMMKVAYANGVKKWYAAGKAQGLEDDEAMAKALTQALSDEAKSAIDNAMMMKMPFAKNTGEGITKSLGKLVRDEAKNLTYQATVAAGTTGLQNFSAAAHGYDINTGQAINEMFESGSDMAKMGASLFLMTKGVPLLFKKLPKYVQSQVKNYLHSVPRDVMSSWINEAAAKNVITLAEKANIETELHSFSEAAKKVPDGLNEYTQGSLIGFIEKKMALEAKKGKFDESFHVEVGKEINSVDEQIKKVIATNDPNRVEIDDTGAGHAVNPEDAKGEDFEPMKKGESVSKPPFQSTPEPKKFFKIFKNNPLIKEGVEKIDIDKVKKLLPNAYNFLKKYKGYENFEAKDIRNALSIAYNKMMKFKIGAEDNVKAIEELEQIVSETEPVRQTTKEKFKQQLKDSGDFDAPQLEIFNSLVDSLNTDMMPDYDSNKESLAFVGLDGHANFYTFSENILAAKNPESFIHEIGHFAFNNILSSEDRVNYLKEMIDAFYGSGKPSIKSKLAITSESPTKIENGKEMTFSSNVGDNFSEYFAEQFRQWYLKEKVTPKGFDAIFSKVEKFLESIVNKLKSGKYVDKDLIKYFDKIISSKETKSEDFQSTPDKAGELTKRMEATAEPKEREALRMAKDIHDKHGIDVDKVIEKMKELGKVNCPDKKESAAPTVKSSSRLRKKI
jgi:hypothetical protein